MKELAKKDQNEVAEVPASDIQMALLAIVQRKDIDPDRLEKFLDLQIKMEDRQAEQALSAALADFQSRCPVIQRTKAGHNSKKYAPLEDLVIQVQPLLLQTGLSYSFNIEPIDDKMNRIDVTIRHRQGGKFISSYFFPKADASGNKNEAQGVRSANSYAKRTAFENALGIVTANEDLDGAKPALKTDENQALSEVKALLTETKADVSKFLTFLGAKDLESLDSNQLQKAIHALKAKKKVTK